MKKILKVGNWSGTDDRFHIWYHFHFHYLNISIIHVINFSMTKQLWVKVAKWFCRSISSVFNSIKSKSESSTTWHIPLRSSLIYPCLKSRSNHKLSGAHPFLTHRMIREELGLLCCLHHRCLLGRRNYWPDMLSLSTRFHFWSWKTFLRPGALLAFLSGWKKCP